MEVTIGIVLTMPCLGNKVDILIDSTKFDNLIQNILKTLVKINYILTKIIYEYIIGMKIGIMFEN